MIGRCLPTRRWNRSDVRRATNRFNRRSADPQFDPLRTGRRVLCDQLPLALDANDSELMVLGHIQTSDLLGLSIEQVDIRHAASVVVEPKRPLDIQLVGFLDTHPLILLDQTGCRIGLPLIDRQVSPIGGKLRRRRVDRQNTLELDGP